MLSEHGWRFLLVEGSCVAWILKSHNDPLRTMTLSREQEQSLVTSLRLSEWSLLEGQHAGGCPDAPGMNYRFDQKRISGPVCGFVAGDKVEELNDAFNTQLAGLYATAASLSGDIRYVVVPEVGGIDNRTPTPWPLEVSVASVAVGDGQRLQYDPGTSRLATGMDAVRLRAIRTTSLTGTTAFGTVFDFTPVVGTDGVKYQLFVRDAVPLENPNGLLPVGVF